MIPIKIKHKAIDLYNFSVTNARSEIQTLNEIQGQIKECLLKMGVDLKIVDTILINKLVYFSVKDIHENKNDHLKVSGGWFRYGPCFENMRKNEMNKFTFQMEINTKEPVEEIIKNCKEEVKEYLKSRDKIDSLEERYFYSYLKHVYKEHADIKEIQPFYETKHELSHDASLQTFSNKIDNRSLVNEIYKFNKAILDEEYLKKVGIPESHTDEVQDFLYGFQSILLSNNETKKRNEPLAELDAHAKILASKFDEDVLGFLSYENYSATYEDIDGDRFIRYQSDFKRLAENYLMKTRYLSEENIALINKLRLERF